MIVRFSILKIVLVFWLFLPLVTRAAASKSSSPTANIGGSVASSSSAKSSDTSGAKTSTGNLLNFQTMQRIALVNEIKQNALSQSEVVWLNQPAIGKFPSTKFLGLTEADRALANQGALLLQPDIGQSADWPGIIKPLRQSLPDAGWFTLAINPPYGLLPVISDQIPPTKPAEKVKSTAVDVSSKNKTKNDASFLAQPPWQDVMKVRINAAMDYLRNKGFQNTVIIGVGKGAQGVLDYVKAQSGRLPAEGFAVILINAKLDKKDLMAFDAAFGKGFASPILDIYSIVNRLAIKEAKIRKKAALRGGFKHYTSLGFLIENTRFIRGSVFEKRIRDWLKVYMPGVKTKLVPAS